MKKNAFVIGTGIAGISLAELLSRNGYKVFLLESSEKIGGEASLATQKWFHTGWLYAALPDRSATMGCYNALKLYSTVYRHIFSEEQINVNVHPDGVEYTEHAKGWFTNERIHFIFAKASYEFNLLTKLYWPVYLNWVYLARMRKLNYQYEKIQGDEKLKELLNQWENNSNGYKNYSIIKTTDAKIQTERIIWDLIHSMSEDTEIITRAEYELFCNNNHTEIAINGTVYKPDVLVIASGKSTPHHLLEIGANEYANKIKSIKSPILVMKESLPYIDFIRYTPKVQHTINHIKFNISNDHVVSTIGSYYSFPVDLNIDVTHYEDLMAGKLGIGKEKILGSYYGIKTEFTGERERKYNHAVKKVNANTYFALAGKFSQFPLLVYDFMTQERLSLKNGNSSSKIKVNSDLFASLYPKEIAEKNPKHSIRRFK